MNLYYIKGSNNEGGDRSLMVLAPNTTAAIVEYMDYYDAADWFELTGDALLERVVEEWEPWIMLALSNLQGERRRAIPWNYYGPVTS